jgi:hypothetical protein
MSKATDFSALAQAVRQLGDSIQSRMASREALAQERDRVAGLPMSRADLIAACDAWIDSVRPHYLKHLQEVLAPRSRRADRPLPEARNGDFGLLGDQFKVTTFPILALLGPQIKASLATMIRELPLDDGDAMPAGERQALLASLDAQIEALDAELADLHQQAAAAGLAPIRRKPSPEEVKALFASQSPTKPEDVALAVGNLERELNNEPPLKRPTPPPKRELIPDRDLPNDF